MKPIILAALAASFAGLGGTAMAQSPDYGNGYYGQNGYYQNGYYQNRSNAQSYQDYQNSLNAYDAARDTAAQQRDVYDQDSAAYVAKQREYRRRMRAYERARAVYDAQWGAGAYEAYYGPPEPWR